MHDEELRAASLQTRPAGAPPAAGSSDLPRRREWLHEALEALTVGAQVPALVRMAEPAAPTARQVALAAKATRPAAHVTELAPPVEVLPVAQGPAAQAPLPGWSHAGRARGRDVSSPGFWLLVTRAGWALSRVWFRRPPVVLGRGLDADLRLECPRASRRHARLEFDGAGWVIHDAGSVNGTFVNGVRVEEQRLRDGDLILLGGYLLVYRVARSDEVDLQDRGAFDPLPEDYAHAARVDPGRWPTSASEDAAPPTGATVSVGARRAP